MIGLCNEGDWRREKLVKPKNNRGRLQNAYWYSNTHHNVTTMSHHHILPLDSTKSRLPKPRGPTSITCAGVPLFMWHFPRSCIHLSIQRLVPNSMFPRRRILQQFTYGGSRPVDDNTAVSICYNLLLKKIGAFSASLRLVIVGLFIFFIAFDVTETG